MRSDRLRLQDTLDAIAVIEQYLPGIPPHSTAIHRSSRTSFVT